jgi:hypothetical protein
MKAQVFTTISSDGEKSTYFESAESFGKHILCNDLNEGINIALYYGYSAKEIKNDIIYFEK